MKTIYSFEVITIDEIPENKYERKNWKDSGVYRIKGDNSLFFVTNTSVEYLYNAENLFNKVNTGDEPQISEQLLLKALAAINGHKL